MTDTSGAAEPGRLSEIRAEYDRLLTSNPGLDLQAKMSLPLSSLLTMLEHAELVDRLRADLDHQRAWAEAAEAREARLRENSEVARSRVMLMVDMGCDDHALKDEAMDYLERALGPLPGDLAAAAAPADDARVHTQKGDT